jgi:hypothetical protein
MKNRMFLNSILSIGLLLSLASFAENSCIKVTTRTMQTVSICGANEAGLAGLLRCDNRSTKCFTGYASQVVSAINTGDIDDGFARVRRGLKLSDDSIQYTFSDMSDDCNQFVSRCN